MSGGMERVFLDANILFSAAYVPTSRLRKLWSLRHTELVSSQFALDEARRNLQAYAPEGVGLLEQLCAGVTIVPEAASSLPLPGGIDLPDKDQPILAAAIGAGCTHLVTGDTRHFGPRYGQRVGGMLVLTPAQYLRRRAAKGRKR
jgi:predicted nucleic acid-binding protein